MKKFLQNLAKGAGAILREGFRKNFEIQTKGAPWNIVTEYDLASERYILEKIKKKFPCHGILAEESGSNGEHKNMWVIDPLDGTHAFARGIPQFCVSIAFVSGGQIKLGAVYDVAADELFLAEKGKGAFLNGKPIRASQASKIQQQTLACLMLGTGGTSIPERQRIYKRAISAGMWMPKVESVALCAAYLAAGRYDILLTKHLWPWDYSAGAIIMQEAGAKVSEANGKKYSWKSDSILAANPKLYPKALKLFKKF